jgi:hypothetical protein
MTCHLDGCNRQATFTSGGLRLPCKTDTERLLAAFGPRVKPTTPMVRLSDELPEFQAQPRRVA